MGQIKSLDELEILDKAVFNGESVTRRFNTWFIIKSDDRLMEHVLLRDIVDIRNWHYYEEPEEIMGRPYTDSELKTVLLKSPWVIKESARFTTQIIAFNENDGEVTAYIDGGSVTAKELFENYTFLDKSIFGVDKV